ncbi:hypothetical protein, variant [Saprolegnia diclina VS20]|nr:hypothetical protein, variant [Saprolegnia diclina VS20]EQC37896.1 hypothetical protein, variant [Saprolegnia diclina VS20]|eukprot:XP_008608829.1 hypothetical protein, variant [Saprolegnia diclina VS20]
MACANPANEALAAALEKILEAEAVKAATSTRNTGNQNHVVSNYKRALYSIRHCAHVIQTGDEAKALKGIGNFIGQKIQGILTRLASGNGRVHEADAPRPKKHKATVPDEPPVPVVAPRERAAPTEPAPKYRPARGKQPWYILVALAELEATCEALSVDTEAVIARMQALGFTSDQGQLRASLVALVSTHKVVARSSLYGHLFLTSDGIQSAQYCQRSDAAAQAAEPGPVARRPPMEAPAITTASTDAPTESFDWASTNLSKFEPKEAPLAHTQDEWEVVLLLDHREMVSRSNPSVFERKLLEAGVTCEVRGLHLGDMIWIARRHRPTFGGRPITEEFVLDVVVERKAVTDLAMSIIDKRYTEQKQRLADTGLRYVVYLLEGSLAVETIVSATALATALTRTQVLNNYLVHHAASPDETVAFLSALHWHTVRELSTVYKVRNAAPPAAASVGRPPASLRNFT